jgi:hypothetical protein
MTDLINVACTQYFVSVDIKDILYSAIAKFGKDKIRMEVINDIENSERRCIEILEECKKKMTNNLDDESFANLCEALLHFMLTASLIPSERKVTWKGAELDLVIPSMKMLNKSPDKTLVIQIIKGNEAVRKIKDAKTIQPHDVNIWTVSAKRLEVDHKNYYVGSSLFPYPRIIVDINAFLAHKGNRGLKLLHGQ